MQRTSVIAAIAITLACAGAARAEAVLSDKVYDPYIKNGVTEVEVRGGRLNGGPLDGEAGATVEFEQGLGDRFSLALVTEFEQHAGEEKKLDSVGLEGVAYLGQIPGIGVDVGAYVEYEQRIHNESGVLETKLLLAKQVGSFQGLVNIISQQPLTNRDGEGAMDFSYAVQGTFQAAPSLKVGLQAFGDLGSNAAGFGGRQAHYLGPVANWETHPSWMPGELELQASYLLPLGTARDQSVSQVRVALEWERRF